MLSLVPEPVVRFLSRILAWVTLHRTCVICGYGIAWFADFRDGPDVPHACGRDIDGRRVSAHQSCIDYADP